MPSSLLTSGERSGTRRPDRPIPRSATPRSCRHVRRRRASALFIRNAGALDDPEHERREPDRRPSRLPHDARAPPACRSSPSRRPERVGHQVLGEGLHQHARSLQQRLPQIGRARQRRAVVERAGRVDRHAVVPDAPRAGDVEVVERQADRIDHPVARRAGRVRAVLLHALAHRAQPAVFGLGGRVEIRARSAAAAAAACRAALPSPTCRAAPARCGRRARSASGCCRGRAARGAGRPGYVTLRNSLPTTFGMP